MTRDSYDILDGRKAHAIRMAVNTVADTLDSNRHYVSYDRFNGSYNESKEIQIEWLEALLSKLSSIDQGNYPAIGFLAHVGRLLKEYEDTYYQGTVLIYLKYMDAFVADGILAEHMEGVSL